MTARGWIVFVILAVGLAAPPTAVAASRTYGPRAAIVTVQVGLRVLGYNPGPIDGLSGPRTVAVLKAYAKDRGIVLNQATVHLVVALLRAEAREELLQGGDADDTQESERPSSVGEVPMLPVGRW